MKKLNLKSMLACLLTLCLLLGGFAALADDPTVTIDATDPNSVSVTIDAGDVDWVGVNANKWKDIAGIGAGDTYVDVEEAERLSGKTVERIGSYTANVDSVTTPEGEGGCSAVRIKSKSGAGDVEINVAGKVTATGKEYVAEEGDSFCDVFGVNIYSETSNTATVNAGDVNVHADGAADEMYAQGVFAEMNDGGKTQIQVGDVTASAENHKEENEDEFKSAYSSGIGVWTYNNKDTVIDISSANVNASATWMGNHGAAEASAVSIGTEYTNSQTVNITVDGDATAEATADEKARAYGVDIDQDDVNDSSVTVEIKGNVKADVSLGDNNSEEGATASGISISNTGSNTHVSVTGKTEANAGVERGCYLDSATGIRVSTEEGGTINVNAGEVSATCVNGNGAVGISSYNTDSMVTINVNGNVTAKGKEERTGFPVATTGIFSTTVGEAVSSIVTVVGDVSASGWHGTGLDMSTAEGSKNEVLIDGTVSGSSIAIAADTSDQKGIFVWAAKENESGEIAKVSGDDAEASAKLEQAIWYIAKVADATLTVTGTDTYAANGTTYQLAHQDENVKLAFALNEAEEGFDGLYYNAENKTAAKADEWGKNDDGSYWVKMLRGGGMLLGLNTHKHEKATREENKVAATCTKAGSYDLVTYCTKCNKVLSTEKKTIAATGHTSGAAVKQNEVAATCAKAGSYDEVVVCTVCKQELSRKAVAVDKLAHTPAEAVRENITAAKPGAPGGYDEVVYCSVCKTELSRAHVDLPALPDEEDPDEAKPAAPQVALVYEPVDENTEVNGVKVADHPEAAEALETIGEALDGETVTVSIPGAEKLMDEAEKERFDKLPVKDRLLVVLSALGFANDGLDDVGEGMSDDAKALSADIAERMEALPENEKQALLNSIAAQFPKGTVTVDGKACESFSIDLVIDRDSAKTYERYTFYNDGSAWKLYGIEKGAYKEV